jgi:hypothetical protein
MLLSNAEPAAIQPRPRLQKELAIKMRSMEIGRFPGERIQITDLASLIKPRLLGDVVIWPDQALPLVGYMVTQPQDYPATLDAGRRYCASAL